MKPPVTARSRAPAMPPESLNRVSQTKQSGTDRGVQDFPIQSGRVWYNPINEVVLTYPTYGQRTVWTAEGLRFTADVNVSYELNREQIPHFYVRFRNDDLEAFTHGFFRDAVRNAFKVSTEYRAEDINGVKQGELTERMLILVARSLTPTLVQWKQLEILNAKWNGQFPQVVGSGGTMQLLSMPGAH